MTTEPTKTWEAFMSWSIGIYAALLASFLLAMAFGGC